MQHDLNLENQQGASFRADLNNALQALATHSSGETEPTSPYPFQTWMDTSGETPVLKRRDAGNTTWKVEDPGIADVYFKRNADGNVVGLKKQQVAADLAPHLGGIDAGTRMVFHQPTAPVGWTQDTTINDRVLRVVNSSGGGQGGSWTISGLSASITVNNTTLSTSQMPSHRHTAGKAEYYTDVAYGSTSGGGQQQSSGGLATAKVYPYTDSVGGGGAHSHSASASVSQNGSWRPAYTDVIVATKD